ncbi:MAG: 4-hydroxy-tetrahydrodipicolinate reductase [Eubacteriales bacterium]
MKILLSGYCGHMGKEVRELIQAGCRGAELAGGVDVAADTSGDAVPCVTSFRAAMDVPACRDADCIIDFSHHSCTQDLLTFAVEMGMPAVLATTGHTVEEKAAIRKAAGRIPVFFSANMSCGIALLVELAKKTAQTFPEAEIEIVEVHHDRKLDAPSGTARMLVEAIRQVRPEAYPVMGRSGQAKRTPEEIGVHSLRIGNVVGEHEVIVATQTQTITLKHQAHSRALFAEGALAAAEFLLRQGPGLYTMADMVKL